VSPPDWPRPENGEGELRGVLEEDVEELESSLLLEPPPKKPPSILKGWGGGRDVIKLKLRPGSDV